MNKIVLITGATSGIGMACARKFAANGDKLILTGRNATRLSEISGELKAQGTDVYTLKFDVRNREAAVEAIEGLPEAWKNIDVLVNNAGLALGLEPEYEGSFDDWDGMIDTGLLGKDCVGLLSKVEMTNLNNNAKMTYTIASPHEANLREGKISIKSPIAQALLNKKVGDVVEVRVPAGMVKLRIDSITL